MLRRMNLRPNDMNHPEFHYAKVKEMHNGVVRVRGNGNSVNLLRMEGGFLGVVLVGSCVIFGILFSVMSYGENGLFESVMIGLGVFLFFIPCPLLAGGASLRLEYKSLMAPVLEESVCRVRPCLRTVAVAFATSIASTSCGVEVLTLSAWTTGSTEKSPASNAKLNPRPKYG